VTIITIKRSVNSACRDMVDRITMSSLIQRSLKTERQPAISMLQVLKLYNLCEGHNKCW